MIRATEESRLSGDDTLVHNTGFNRREQREDEVPAGLRDESLSSCWRSRCDLELSQMEPIFGGIVFVLLPRPIVASVSLLTSVEATGAIRRELPTPSESERVDRRIQQKSTRFRPEFIDENQGDVSAMKSTEILR